MKTAVEWLKNQVEKEDGVLTKGFILILLEQAKEMEKQKIIKAAASAYEDMYGTDGTEYGEKYYNKLTQDDK